MARVVNQVESIYSSSTGEYHRKVGSKEFFETRLSSDQPTNLNPATGQINISCNLSGGYVYDLSEAYCMLIVQIGTAVNTGFAGGSIAALTPDTFFSEVSVQISTQDINQVGSKKYCHKGAHALKLMKLSPDRAKMIKDLELFYPDSSNSSLAEVWPYSLTGYAVGVATLGGNTNTTEATVLAIGNVTGVAGGIVAPANNAAPVLSVDVLQGNAVCALSKNGFYNESFDSPKTKFNAGAFYAVCVPLKYYVPSLCTLSEGLANISLKLTFQKPQSGECVKAVNGVAAGSYFIAPNGFELRIPTYAPDSERAVALTTKISRGVKEIRKYVDLDIYPSSTIFSQGATSTVATFVNAVNRRPVMALFGFQYTGDYQTQLGDTHRYFNPNFKTSQIQLGSGQYFPKSQYNLLGTSNTGLTTYPVAPFYPGEVTTNSGFTTDQTQLYREFLRCVGLLNDDQGACLIDYEMWLKHKCFLAFDMRDIDEQYFSIGNPLNLSLNCTHDAILTNAQLATLYGAATNTICGLPGGTYQVWLYLFTERAIEITQSASGTTVRSDVDDPY